MTLLPVVHQGRVWGWTSLLGHTASEGAPRTPGPSTYLPWSLELV